MNELHDSNCPNSSECLDLSYSSAVLEKHANLHVEECVKLVLVGVFLAGVRVGDSFAVLFEPFKFLREFPSSAKAQAVHFDL